MIAEKSTTTRQIADRLSQLFKENKWKEAQEELFHEKAESIEPKQSEGLQSVKGLDKIRQKAVNFDEMVEEMHGGFVSEPLVAGNFIAFSMGMDVTMKGQGRMKMEEIALYEVKEGKIIKEQFFY